MGDRQISSPKRLSRQARRCQLLQVAKGIVESEGADGLTLAVLALRAGVSKPVAYDHFETRAGLLLAMLEDTARYYENDARSQIEASHGTLIEVSHILSEAYVACTQDAGPSISTVMAAIEANAEVREAGRAFRIRHAEQFQEAFAPLIFDEGDKLRLLFSGLIAAADAICTEMTNGHITEKAAVDTIEHMLMTSLSPFARR